MADIIASAVEGVARSWRREAEERRKISKSDPVADTLEYCAGEMTARVRSITVEETHETVEDRAKREKVTPQTIRLWIRTNQLAAQDGPKGYLIPRSAERVRRSA